MYSFKAKIASRSYHVFKETSWSNAKEGDEVKVELETNKSSKKIDPYACAIRVKEEYFKGWKTFGHIPREISRHVYFFIKSEGGSVNGTVISTKYRTSPIPAGGLEIPLLLTFSWSKAINFEKIKTFVQTLYDYKFTGTVIEEENSDDEDEIIVINESDSQTVNNYTQLVGYSDSENEDETQDGSEESNSEYEGEKQDGSEESNSEYENENQDGSEESNSEDENENQGGNNIPILNDENEIEIVLITE